MSFTAFVPYLKDMQESLMTERCRIIRNGILVASDVACRVTSSRLFAEPADPQDANMRSMQEWGWTMPLGTDVEVGDVIEKMDNSISTIAGEVMKHDTWATAIRVWATRPKTSTPHVTITLYRLADVTEVWTSMGSFDVQVVWDRNAPTETPIRYSPSGHAVYKGGWVIGDMDFDPQVGDRFALDGYGAYIADVAPFQPQRREAKFQIDISGSHL